MKKIPTVGAGFCRRITASKNPQIKLFLFTPTEIVGQTDHYVRGQIDEKDFDWIENWMSIAETRNRLVQIELLGTIFEVEPWLMRSKESDQVDWIRDRLNELKQ